MRSLRDFFVQVLGEVLSSSKLLEHEFQEEVLPSVASEFSSVQASPAALAFDAFTQAAYRQRGLGASLYASPITPVSHDAAVSFARAAFAKSNLAVLGSGIDAGALASLVSKHFQGVASSGSVAAGASKYFGGDARIAYAPAHSDSPRASDGHVVFGFEGAALGSPELAVLRAHLGGEAAVKWSTGLSPLAAVSAGHPGVQANAFNLGFSDSGLFGAHVSAPHAKIGEVAKAAAQAFKKAADSISSEDLSRAVAKAKFEAAAALENRATTQAVAGAQVSAAGGLGRTQLLLARAG
jgi:ubiquinol-cytochrome c reductase core subunit 2